VCAGAAAHGTEPGGPQDPGRSERAREASRATGCRGLAGRSGRPWSARARAGHLAAASRCITGSRREHAVPTLLVVLYGYGVGQDQTVCHTRSLSGDGGRDHRRILGSLRIGNYQPDGLVLSHLFGVPGPRCGVCRRGSAVEGAWASPGTQGASVMRREGSQLLGRYRDALVDLLVTLWARLVPRVRNGGESPRGRQFGMRSDRRGVCAGRCRIETGPRLRQSPPTTVMALLSQALRHGPPRAPGLQRCRPGACPRSHGGCAR
jgi:hypothetical protein